MAAERIWRAHLALRAGAILAATILAGVSALMVWQIATGPWSGLGAGGLIAAFGAALTAAYLFRWGQRAGIVLDEDTLTVISAWKTYRIPLHDVLMVRGGYYGLEIKVRGRTFPITASAVQKSNWANWIGRRTRADEVADAIFDARNRLTAAGMPPVPDNPR